MKYTPGTLEEITHTHASAKAVPACSSKKYLIIFFTDGSTFAIPREVMVDRIYKLVVDQCAREDAAKGDMDYSDALKLVKQQIKPKDVKDHQILGYAQMMPWEEVKVHAKQITGTLPVINFQEDLKHCPKGIATESEIDRYKLQKSAV